MKITNRIELPPLTPDQRDRLVAAVKAELAKGTIYKPMPIYPIQTGRLL